jgi:hypothetical protein
VIGELVGELCDLGFEEGSVQPSTLLVDDTPGASSLSAIGSSRSIAVARRIARLQQLFAEGRELPRRTSKLQPDLIRATQHLVDLGARQVHE